MTMKRRKRKRKPKSKQDSKLTDQTRIDGEIEQPAGPVGIQVEPENLASPDPLRDETQNHTRPVVESADTDEPAPESTARTGADRRSHPRYAFTAAVEIVAGEPGPRLKTRVRDLSEKGCYVDSDSPFALGIVADVRITKGVESFEARARVVYTQPGKGMGLMFTAVEPLQLGTLNTWIGACQRV